MSLQWPESLVPELAERRCIIVLGAGASAGCIAQDGTTTPLNWPDLLDRASGHLDDADKEIVKSLLSQRHYLDAAEIVRAKVNTADYASFVRQIFVEPRFAHSEIHEQILTLDPKIVVTTNYDDIYETYCKQGQGEQGYNVCRYYESHALNDVRSTTRVILKMHGCVSDPHKTVLARTEYHEAKRDHARFFELLDSLFMTNTLLFLGCSLDDPDFKLLLEGTNIRCPSEHPHYAVVESGKPAPLVTAMRTVYNVQCLEYPHGEYDNVVQGLKDLNDRVGEWRRTHP